MLLCRLIPMTKYAAASILRTVICYPFMDRKLLHGLSICQVVVERHTTAIIIILQNHDRALRMRHLPCRRHHHRRVHRLQLIGVARIAQNAEAAVIIISRGVIIHGEKEGLDARVESNDETVHTSLFGDRNNTMTRLMWVLSFMTLWGTFYFEIVDILIM